MHAEPEPRRAAGAKREALLGGRLGSNVDEALHGGSVIVPELPLVFSTYGIDGKGHLRGPSV